MTPADVWVIEQVAYLDYFMEAHRMMTEEGHEAAILYPEEIMGLVDFDAIERFWKVGDYNEVRYRYIMGWSQYIQDVTGVRTEMTWKEIQDAAAEK